jgi:hypothetical protein
MECGIGMRNKLRIRDNCTAYKQSLVSLREFVNLFAVSLFGIMSLGLIFYSKIVYVFVLVVHLLCVYSGVPRCSTISG